MTDAFTPLLREICEATCGDGSGLIVGALFAVMILAASKIANT